MRAAYWPRRRNRCRIPLSDGERGRPMRKVLHQWSRKNSIPGHLPGRYEADYTIESKGFSAPQSADSELGFGLHLRAQIMAKSAPRNRIRIVIADDHAVLRESLAALLTTQEDFVLEGLATNGQEALALTQQRHPDVLVLDLFMPQSDAFEVL